MWNFSLRDGLAEVSDEYSNQGILSANALFSTDDNVSADIVEITGVAKID
jgi:hypothetical protein